MRKFFQFGYLISYNVIDRGLLEMLGRAFTLISQVFPEIEPVTVGNYFQLCQIFIAFSGHLISYNV